MAAAISNLYGEAVDNGFSSTYTISGRTLGTGTFIVFFFDDVGRTTTGATIGGVTATNVVTTTGSKSSLWYADVATSTGSIVFSATAGYGLVGICCGLLTGISTSAPTSFTSVNSGFSGDPQSIGPLTIPNNGIGFVAIGDETITGNPTTWANATRDAATEASIATGNTTSVAAAHVTGTGAAVTPTATGASGNGWGFSGATMIYAAWDVASAGPSAITGPIGMQTNLIYQRKMVGY